MAARDRHLLSLWSTWLLRSTASSQAKNGMSNRDSPQQRVDYMHASCHLNHDLKCYGAAPTLRATCFSPASCHHSLSSNKESQPFCGSTICPDGTCLRLPSPSLSSGLSASVGRRSRGGQGRPWEPRQTGRDPSRSCPACQPSRCRCPWQSRGETACRPRLKQVYKRFMIRTHMEFNTVVVRQHVVRAWNKCTSGLWSAQTSNSTQLWRDSVSSAPETSVQAVYDPHKHQIQHSRGETVCRLHLKQAYKWLMIRKNIKFDTVVARQRVVRAWNKCTSGLWSAQTSNSTQSWWDSVSPRLKQVYKRFMIRTNIKFNSRGETACRPRLKQVYKWLMIRTNMEFNTVVVRQRVVRAWNKHTSGLWSAQTSN